jgi:hypothetical protein
MTAQTKLGGVDRDALLRLWFLFYVWACVGSVFIPDEPWRWFAWLGGSALTCILLYRRNRLAGIVGYIVCAAAVATTLPLALTPWGALVSSHYDAATLFTLHRSPLFPLLYQTSLAFVPTVVLGVHVASRHRLLRGFEGRMVERRHARIIAPSSYYLVTFR